MIANIGRAVSIVARQEAADIIMHDDIAAFHAPSECHALVARGEARRMVVARWKAAAIAGVPWRAIKREAERRIGRKAFARAFDRAVARVLARTSPFV